VPGGRTFKLLEEIRECTITFERDSSKGKVYEAMDTGTSPQDILNNGLIAAMEQIGWLSEAGEFFIPEMLLAGKIIQEDLAGLKPYLPKGT
jgi:5-methyltetrahydrofolate--homocysteine methyltransferase